MFSSIFQTNYKKINFEDLQTAIKNTHRYLIINTLFSGEQSCLIQTTLPYELEEKTINDLLASYDLSTKHIIIYGKNTNDETVETKYKQLNSLGFSNVYMYMGGIFEWLLLQDIYGVEEFPTTTKVLDILKYRPKRIL
jgi:uncharacterized protein (DUF433 family)